MTTGAIACPEITTIGNNGAAKCSAYCAYNWNNEIKKACPTAKGACCVRAYTVNGNKPLSCLTRNWPHGAVRCVCKVANEKPFLPGAALGKSYYDNRHVCPGGKSAALEESGSGKSAALEVSVSNAGATWAGKCTDVMKCGKTGAPDKPTPADKHRCPDPRFPFAHPLVAICLSSTRLTTGFGYTKENPIGTYPPVGCGQFCVWKDARYDPLYHGKPNPNDFGVSECGAKKELNYCLAGYKVRVSSYNHS